MRSADSEISTIDKLYAMEAKALHVVNEAAELEDQVTHTFAALREQMAIEELGSASTYLVAPRDFSHTL